MRTRASLLALAVTVSLTAALAGFQSPTSATIRLRLPDGIDLTGLGIRYYLTGPFGGFGGFVQTDPKTREYGIDLTRQGKLAGSFKAVIYRPGSRFVLLRESVTEGLAARTLSIDLEPLGSIPLTGEIILVRPVLGLSIHGTYLANWGHDFYGIVDGFVDQFPVGTTEIEKDGSFTLNVPDFMRDPTVAAHTGYSRGSFLLEVYQTGTGNRVYRLEEVARPGRSAEIPVASDYSRSVQLVVRTN